MPEIPASSSRSGPHSLAAVADAAEAEAPPRRLMLTGVAPLQTAGPGEVSFLDNRKYAAALAETAAGAVIVHPDMADRVPRDRRRHRRRPNPMPPGHGWRRCSIRCRRPRPGVHPSAVVAPDAAGRSERRDRAAGGDRCPGRDRPALPHRSRRRHRRRRGARRRLPDRRACLAQPRAARRPRGRLSRAPASARTASASRAAGEGFLSVPQLGRVVLEDDVEIGANTTIDRGALHDTRDRRRLAPRQPGADRAQRAPWPRLRDRRAGRHFRFHDPGRPRHGRRPGGSDGPSADRQRGRGSGRRPA